LVANANDGYLDMERMASQIITSKTHADFDEITNEDDQSCKKNAQNLENRMEKEVKMIQKGFAQWPLALIHLDT
jgi:hypothetical protein